MAQNDVYQVSCFTSYRNQVAVNVLYWFQQDATPVATPTLANLVTFAASVSALLSPRYRAIISQEARYEGLTVKYLATNPALDMAVQNTTNAGVGGWSTAGTAPSQVAGLIRKKGTFASRRDRGRMYVPFVPLGAVANDDLADASYLTELDLMATAITTGLNLAITGGTAALYATMFARKPTRVITPIQSTRVLSGFATQRRRGFFGRPNSLPF